VTGEVSTIVLRAHPPTNELLLFTKRDAAPITGKHEGELETIAYFNEIADLSAPPGYTTIAQR